MNMQEFYAVKGRHSSPECDYGVWWVGEKPWPKYRVSYIKATGEVYAVSTSGDEVEILGVVPPDEKEIYYETLDQMLDGWAEMCGKQNSLQWVRDRMSER